MKILVGVDGTDRSLEAIRFVTCIASADHDQLTLCFAPGPRGRPVFLLSRDEQEAMLAAFADFVLKRALAIGPAGFSRATRVPAHAQKVSQTLLEAAQQSGSDLIVVGAGRSSHRLQFLVGGVARSVIHESDRPVLAYRSTDDGRPSGPLRVLLAADPVEPFAMAVDILHQFSWPAGSRGQVMHVIDYVEDERLRHWINHSATRSSSAWNAAMDQEVQTGARARVRGAA